MRLLLVYLLAAAYILQEASTFAPAPKSLLPRPVLCIDRWRGGVSQLRCSEGSFRCEIVGERSAVEDLMGEMTAVKGRVQPIFPDARSCRRAAISSAVLMGIGLVLPVRAAMQPGELFTDPQGEVSHSS